MAVQGKYTLYNALLRELHWNPFTLQEALEVQLKNLGKYKTDWFIYSNLLGELGRFVQEGRAVKIKRGVYRLTPNMHDLDVWMHAKPRRPRVRYIHGWHKIDEKTGRVVWVKYSKECFKKVNTPTFDRSVWL